MHFPFYIPLLSVSTWSADSNNHFLLHAQCSCVLEFDGAAKGNPGPAGAGAVLRAIDGSLVYTLTPHLEYIIFCSIRFSDIEVCRFTVYVKVWELQQIMLPNTGQSF